MKDEVEKQIFDILEQNNLSIGYNINFPQYRELPDEVKLSLKILSKHGMVIEFILKSKGEEVK